jgi:hypothetical protein
MYGAGPVAPHIVDQIWQTYWSGGLVNDLGLAPVRPSIPELLIDGFVQTVG